ncbi:MAG TPA: C40 family peptidase [Burkholderiales bacterium]|jgi:cell wall-associated NlpC family hydrolase|nr:C40 family peptidase [Burkholderiales bacterium]
MTTYHGAFPGWISLRLSPLLLLAALAGCAGAPEVAETPATRASDETARKAVAFAREMIGKPYRYAGDTPAGFDCSGLVRYSYGRAGISMPRATQPQRNATKLISVRSLRPGDLLFFDQEGKKASHVGIYLGDGRFVHAPSTGGRVRTDSLGADYWKKHFVEARRV